MSGPLALDQLAELLSEIKLRDERVWQQRGNPEALLAIEEAKDDAPRLIAALEAVIGFHRATYRYRGKTKCGTCSESVPCLHLQAIHRALIGEEVPW